MTHLVSWNLSLFIELVTTNLQEQVSENLFKTLSHYDTIKQGSFKKLVNNKTNPDKDEDKPTINLQQNPEIRDTKFTNIKPGDKILENEKKENEKDKKFTNIKPGDRIHENKKKEA